MKPLLIIAGPTASGKSALALALAQRIGGTIVNADAMQCYRELRIVTARPAPAEEALAPHRLYGVRAAAEPANAAWWRQAALAACAAAERPILCGGTGMYFSALIHGIAEIPEPGAAAREAARRGVAERGAPAVHALLDAATAAQLKPNDRQRVARGYELLLGTGQGLAHWQAQPRAPLTGYRLRMLLLDPPRAALKAAIAARFEAMLAAGAVEEVRDFLALGLDPALPLMRAHGVPELAKFLRGEWRLGDAAERAVLATHQYTKRQMTWFRHQALVDNADMRILATRIGADTQFSESYVGDLVNFINHGG